MGKDGSGALAMLRVTLRPEVEFGAASTPTQDVAAAMHHEAHERCFIARSVKTDVRCEPVSWSSHPSRS
jgi:organic hydroperoxide reductase OsmC/OhrA